MWGAAGNKTTHKKSVVTKQHTNFGVARCSRSLVVRGRWVSDFAVAGGRLLFAVACRSRSLVVAREMEGGRLGHPLKKSNNPNTEGWGKIKKLNDYSI